MTRIAPLLLAATLAPTLALADERPYAFTYDTTVSAAGEKELELYVTEMEPRSRSAVDRWWEYKLELGYGVTDKLSLSAYGVFRTTNATNFEFSAVKVEGRYKLLSSDAPFDLVLYLEGEKEVVDDKPWAIEEKLLLGRTYSSWSWAANLIAEQEWPSGGGQEIKWGWSVGAAYKVNNLVRLGAETFGEKAKDVDGVVSWETYAGPTGVITLPSGPFNSAWLIVGAGFGLRQEDDLVRFRVVLGGDF